MVDADLLLIGADSVDAFAGLNGGTSDALGLSLENGDLALALVSDRSNPGWRWMALEAAADEVAFVGLDGITLLGKGLVVEINQNTSFTTNTAMTGLLWGSMTT